MLEDDDDGVNVNQLDHLHPATQFIDRRDNFRDENCISKGFINILFPFNQPIHLVLKGPCTLTYHIIRYSLMESNTV